MAMVREKTREKTREIRILKLGRAGERADWGLRGGWAQMSGFGYNVKDQ